MFRNKKTSTTGIIVTSFLLLALIAGPAVIPAPVAVHPSDTIVTVASDPQTLVDGNLGPDSTLFGTAPAPGVLLEDDPLIKYRDLPATGGNNIRDVPGSECIFYDANNNGVIELTAPSEAITGTCTGTPTSGPTIKDDPRLKFFDSTNDNLWTRGSEPVVHDLDQNGVYNPGTNTFTTTVLGSNFVDGFAWQLEIRYNPAVLNVRFFGFGDTANQDAFTGWLQYIDNDGSTTRDCSVDTCLFTSSSTVDNVAGEARAAHTLLSGAVPVTDPLPLLMVTVNWRVAGEGSSAIHLATDAEDPNFGIQTLDSEVKNILYDTDDGFVSTVAGTLAPDPEFTATSRTPSPGETVSFDAAASTNVATFQWNFGDGTTGTGTTTSRAYATACDPVLRPRPIAPTGCYRAVLTGTTSAGLSAMASKVIIVRAAAAFDYSLALGPTSGTVLRPGSTTTTATLTLTAGTAQAITLSASGQPADVTITFSPNPVTPTSAGATSTVTLTVGPTAPTGTFTITISGSPAGATPADESAAFSLTIAVRATTTGVNCTPSSVNTGTASSCTATVTDSSPTPVTPTGTVSWTSSGTGTFSASSCTLTGAGSSASCSVNHTPTAVGTGTHTITGSYDGDGAHSGSSGTFALTVTEPVHATTTTVDCAPATVVVGQQTVCTATVTDISTTAPSTPTGSVNFGTSGAGTFSAASCTLAGTSASSASCSVDYTPTTVGAGPHTITGSYGGDTAHGTSTTSTPFSVTVNKRETSTTVECVPSTVVIGETSICTATVTDISPGTAITPTGSISRTGGSCALSGTGASASCTITIIPSAQGTMTISASYGGDQNHLPSSGSGSLTVNLRVTSTTVDCVPAFPSPNVASTCTATVTDTSPGIVTTPTGLVTWTHTNTGSFSTPTCNLTGTGSSSSCFVTYTPTATGSHVVTGSYVGDLTHAVSSATFDLTVTPEPLHPTSTTVNCTPLDPLMNNPTSCTATVTDTSTTGATTPTGSVSFTSTGVGTFSPPSCTLEGTGSSASCSVNYTPTTGTGTHTITASYGGDAAHDTSSDTVDITASLRAATATIDCTPASVNTGAASTCTATVVDPSPGNAVTPSGSVDFTSSGAGDFSATSCILTGTGSSASCSVDYTPTAVGTGSHTITGNYGGDQSHQPSSDEFVVIVTEANRAPVAADDSYSTAEDTPLSVNVPGVLANDSDLDGDALSAVLVTGPSSGTLTLNSDGSFTYTPTSNFNGQDSFTYRASDGALTSDAASVTITVTSVNDAPVANDDAYSTPQGSTLTVDAPGVLRNDVDVDGDALTATLESTTVNGVLSLNADGSFTYTPDTGFSGTDSFTYRANDASLSSGIVTVTINVGANQSPTSVNDSYLTDEDMVLTVSAATGVLANDTDPEDDSLTAILVSGPSSGTLTLNSDGSFSYTSAANFNGQITFAYQANDGFSNSNIATVTINVNPVNDAPVAVNDSYTTEEDTVLDVPMPGVLSNDSDVDGDVLTAVLHTGPSSGTLVLNSDGSFTYTPNLNFFGTDSFTYGAHDSLTFTEATVTIMVSAVNDAPIAANDSHSTDQNTPLTVPAPGVLGNDSDVDNGDLSAVLVTGPSSGTLDLNADGGFTYTPNTGFSGTDSFTYRADDGADTSNVATVTINVRGPENRPPVAVDDSYSTAEDTPLSVDAPGTLANDTDPDGDTLSAVLVSGPSSGTLTLNSDGSFTYTPASNFNGQVTFTYEASDGDLNSDPATVTITVTSVNDAPVANNDAYSTDQDTALTVPPPGVLDNDSDDDGDDLGAVLVVGPSSGTLTLNNDGSFTYTPNAGFSGTDTFTYQANDGPIISNTATVTITVEEAPPTGQVFLTFDAFDADHFTNGVGELDVFINGVRVVNIPAGLNGLTGTGVYDPYDDTWVSFGPFDITLSVQQGLNTLTFSNPLTSHSSRIRNVRVVQGETVLLFDVRTRGVDPSSPKTVTFSVPPLVLTSFNISSTAFVTEPATFTATFTGGTASFRCTFSFGDGSSRSVTTNEHTCSATHTYWSARLRTATVRVRGAAFADDVRGTLLVKVEPQPGCASDDNDNGEEDEDCLAWNRVIASGEEQTFTARLTNPASLAVLIRLDFTITRPDGSREIFISPSFALNPGQTLTGLSFPYTSTGGLGKYCFKAPLRYGIDMNNNGILENAEVLGNRTAESGCFRVADVGLEAISPFLFFGTALLPKARNKIGKYLENRQEE